MLFRTRLELAVLEVSTLHDHLPLRSLDGTTRNTITRASVLSTVDSPLQVPVAAVPYTERRRAVQAVLQKFPLLALANPDEEWAALASTWCLSVSVLDTEGMVRRCHTDR